MINHIDPEEEGLEKKLSNEGWFTFTKNIEINYLKLSIISFKVFYHNQKVYQDYCTENIFQHVLSKKNLFKSKNCRKLVRKGVPLKSMREFLLKLFNVEISEDDYKQKYLTIFKSFDTTQLGDYIPSLNIFNTFSESLRIHFLNEIGVISTIETMWIIDNIFPQINFCPLIIKIISLVLLFCDQIETYHIIKAIIEINLEYKDLFKLRWHFRFSLNENNKIISSIIESLNEISKKSAKTLFTHFEKINFPVNKLIEDMVFGFFLDYLNFEGIIRLFPLFLVEGVKSLYRLTYAILKELKDKILLISSPDDIIKITRQNAKAINDIDKLFETAFSYGLTRYNNKFDYKVNLDDTINRKPVFYIPNLNTSSSIIKINELVQLWTLLPENMLQRDAKMIYNSEIQGNSIQTIYSLNNVYKNDSDILFIIETTQNEVFGGVLSKLFKSNSKYEKPSSAILYSIRPVFQVYDNVNNCEEILYCGQEMIKLGNGPKGPAISINEDIMIGQCFEGNCFGFQLYNKTNNFEIFRMEIFNLL
jgi:hypothetical protein